MFTASYVTTFNDFVAAQRLARKHHRLMAAAYYFWYGVVPLLALAALAALIYDFVPGHAFLPAHVGPYLAGLVGAGLYLAILRPIAIRRSYRQTRGGRPADAPVEFELTGTEIISRIPGRSEGRFLPSAVISFAEDDRIALIYVAKKRFLFVPKTALTAAQWTMVRHWVAQRKEKT